MARSDMGEDHRGEQRRDGNVRPMPHEVELCAPEKTFSVRLSVFAVYFGYRFGRVFAPAFPPDAKLSPHDQE